MNEFSESLTFNTLLPGNSELLDELGKANITTVDDLFNQINAPESRSSKLRALEHHIFLPLAAVGTTAHEELHLVSRSKSKCTLQTGISSLDSLLLGSSFKTHTLAEISGLSGSGKTALALRLALYHLVQNLEDHVLWVDTTGGFSASRADAVLGAILQTLETAGVSRHQTLDRLSIASAFDLHEFASIVNKVHRLLDEKNAKVSYLVVDKLNPIFSPYLLAGNAYGHASMNHLLRKLAFIARKHNFPVLLINDGVVITDPKSSSEPSFKPGLGPSFAFMTDQTIWLSKTRYEMHPSDLPVFKAELLRSRSKPGCFCQFILRNGVQYEELKEQPDPDLQQSVLS